jgi:hypothetical protein
MSDYHIMNPIAGTQSIADTSTTQLQVLGTIVQANDVASTAYGAGQFIYLAGVASTVLGSWVTFNQDDNTTALLAANGRRREKRFQKKNMDFMLILNCGLKKIERNLSNPVTQCSVMSR